MHVRVAIILGLLTCGVSPALAQGGTSGANVTLQLPSFSTVGVNTSVLVPDSGAAPFAAHRQAAYGRTTYRGLNPQQAIGAQRAAAVASVSAQVHDLRKIDEEILHNARSRRANWVRGSTAARPLGSADPALLSVAEIERRHGLPDPVANREATALVEKAQLAQATGKPRVAALYYKLALKRATGPLKDEIEQAARGLRTAALPSAPDSRRP
jgi:hypothetical protein